MASSGRTRNRLSPRKVQTVVEPGYYGDGGGLYLQVSRAGTKSWIFRFTLNKRTREMGLGSLHVVSLKSARELADKNRMLVAQRIDPIEHRSTEHSKRAADHAARKTFRDCAEAYVDAHEAGWSNVKHAAQWRNTLATYAYPVCGDLAVAQVNVGHVTEILEPIWKTKTETASRLRGRIESVLDWATVRGYRTGENPARWRGHLAKLLPKRSAVQKVKHHGAVPYEEVGAFVRKVRQSSGIAPAALEFVILTAVRTGEALRAKWSEISLDRKDPTWTIPAERMKAKREHRVPLAPRAVEILASMEPLRDKGDYLFPSPMNANHPLSDMALLMIVRRLAGNDKKGKTRTTHGFRSTFRDWASERTNYPRELAEAALAHVVGDKVEAAYRRGDLFEKRRRLMADWEKFCGTVGTRGANVVKLRA
jgi:integrase